MNCLRECIASDVKSNHRFAFAKVWGTDGKRVKTDVVCALSSVIQSRQELWMVAPDAGQGVEWETDVEYACNHSRRAVLAQFGV